MNDADKLVEEINNLRVPPHLAGRHGPFCPGDNHYCPEGGCSKGKCARHHPEVIAQIKAMDLALYRAADWIERHKDMERKLAEAQAEIAGMQDTHGDGIQFCGKCGAKR